MAQERAGLIADVQKNMVIFPNLVINDNVGFTVRVIEPVSTNSMRVNAWALAPVNESPKMRALRLDNFVSFLGPAGFGSADDVEMLELCQRGVEHAAVDWNEISKGMRGGDPRIEECGPDDEGQMRAYWAQWDLMIRGPARLQPERGASRMTNALVSRSAIEEFLYHEADLLDTWRLPEWSELFTDDARYDIASLDSEDPAERPILRRRCSYSADDKLRLVSRAKRLMKKTAHAEYPHSKTRHITSNVRIGEVNGDEVAVRANFVIYRTQGRPDRSVHG